MDPVTALGVAAAVLQFVDFSVKLVSKTSELHSSASGLLAEHTHLNDVAEVLNKQCLTLRQYSKNSMPKTNPLPGEETLQNAIFTSSKTADELIDCINQLRVTQTSTAFKSLRQALKSILGKDGVDTLAQRLRDLRSSLIVSLLVVMRAENLRSAHDYSETLKETERSILTAIKDLQVDQGHALQALSRSVFSNATQRLVPWGSVQNTRKSLRQAAVTWQGQNIQLVNQLSTDIGTRVMSATEHQSYLNMLKSLSFREINERYNRISKAQAKTFDWIFDADDMKGSKWSSFRDWLTDGDPTASRFYWISGKPGSGKSTLMRFMLDHSEIKSLAEQGQDRKPAIIVSCFFWLSGTQLQNSQQGLLQTILYQLLNGRPSLHHHLMQSKDRLIEAGFEPDYMWSEDELWEAIAIVVKELSIQHSILVMIDGLDEFYGTEEQRLSMCKLLISMTSGTSVKICVASRPWNVYKDYFFNAAQLRMEDLTENDIFRFVSDKLQDNHHFSAWACVDSEKSLLLREQIVQKASGVFLWVRLVVNSLVQGLNNGDDAHELFDRLDEIPPDLETYFQTILASLSPSYRAQASEMLELALAGTKLVMIYYFCRTLRDYTDAALCNVPKLTLADVERLQLDEERRINARCMGLLEVSESSQRGIKRVGFMHRTVRDFVASKSVQKELHEWRRSDFNALLSRLYGTVACVKSSYSFQGASYAGWLGQEILDDGIINCLRVAKDDCGQKRVSIALRHLQDRLEPPWTCKARPWLYEARAMRPPPIEQEADFFGHAIALGLCPYVLEVLANGMPSKLSTICGQQLSYLHCAVWPKHVFSNAQDTDIFVLSRLLEVGYDPNAVYMGSTFWNIHQRVLDFPTHSPFLSGLYFGDRQIKFEQTKLMIEHGASGSDLGKEEGGQPPATDIDIFYRFFEEAQAKELKQLVKRQKREKGVLGSFRLLTNRQKRSFISKRSL